MNKEWNVKVDFITFYKFSVTVINTENTYAIVGKIVNTQAEEVVLDEKGKVVPEKLNALIFDQFQHGYYICGEKVGKAWNAGKELMKK